MSKERESVKIDVDQMADLVHGSPVPGYITIRTKYEGEWRHGTEHSMVVMRESDNKYFEFYYRDSPKETMDFSDMNDSTVMHEVFEVTKTITDYV